MSALDTALTAAVKSALKSSDDFVLPEPPKVRWVRKRGSNNNCPIYYSKEVKKLDPFESYFVAECKRLILGKVRSNPGKIVLVGFKLFYKQRVLRGSRWHREHLSTHFNPTEVNEENLDSVLNLYCDLMYNDFIDMEIDLENHEFCEKDCEHNVLFCNFTNFFIYFIIGEEKLSYTDISIHDL